MPPYQPSYIGRNVQQATPGIPAYLWGSRDRNSANTRMRISTVQLTSPTAQVTGTVIEGNIPVLGQLVSIQGAVPDYFNVTNAVITAVSAPATPDVGVYTISFALTNANVINPIASPGIADAPPPEVGESIISGASQSIALQSNVNPDQMRAIRFDVTFPTQLGSVDVVAQSAVIDEDSQYSDLGTVASLVGGVLNGSASLTVATTVFSEQTALFVRLINRNLAGVSSSKVVGKVTV